jgi:hypothetical protein
VAVCSERTQARVAFRRSSSDAALLSLAPICAAFLREHLHGATFSDLAGGTQAGRPDGRTSSAARLQVT